MTRFGFSGDGTWGAGDGARSFSYAAENLEGFNAYLEKARDALARSEAILEATITHLNNRPGKRAAEVAFRYFKTSPKKLEGDDLAMIKKRLTKTRNGLTSGRLALKIHSGASVENDRAAVGKVRWRGEIPDGGRYIQPLPSKKPYHTTIAPLQKSGVWRAGAIHITRERLYNDDRACRTIIHEATHKYIGTNDYCYFDEDGLGPADGYYLDDRSFALCNADSFAWFAVTIHGHIANGDSMD